MPYTLVSFHAHPDDESLLTGGTLARAAAEGHRVVLVVATDGEAGWAEGSTDSLGERRRAELDRAAQELGVARVIRLGYPDSGFTVPTGHGFADRDPAEPAARLAEILAEEGADALTTYDEFGGYGHPDHRQVHVVGKLAAALAGTPVVLEATVDRDTLRRVIAPVNLLARVLPWLAPKVTLPAEAYTERAELTHVVDVRAQVPAKLRALAAHHSQTTGGGRTVRLLLAMRGPLGRKVLGREWFREPGRPPGPVVDDVFDSLRTRMMPVD